MADDGLLVRTLFYECDGEVPLGILLFCYPAGCEIIYAVRNGARLPGHSRPQAYQRAVYKRWARFDGSGRNVSEAVGKSPNAYRTDPPGLGMGRATSI